MLKIYNTLTRSKEMFRPIRQGEAGMYVCGVTVYDECHIGHARTFVAFDVIRRYLAWRGFKVTMVRNITDVDDKIIRRAAENGETISALTERSIARMHADFDQLGIEAPDLEPRATETIPAMLAMIGELVDKGQAYQGAGGDVYFHVPAFPAYGRLSGQNLAALQSGERVEVAADKRDALDFVLWKRAREGEPAWPSPWGPGRPGWHIECSAMAREALGATFDIHGGGSDLQFPHHENEIAQSEAANRTSFARYWLHSGMVQVDEEKMSKSLNNFFTIADVLKHCRTESLRYFLLHSHYRSQLNYSDSNIRAADAALERLYGALREVAPAGSGNTPVSELQNSARDRFTAAMDDDFNTPVAIAVLFDLVREIHQCREMNPQQARELAGELRRLGGILGLLQQDPAAFLQQNPGGDQDLSVDEIEKLIAERNTARAARDWAGADAARDRLISAGIVLEDSREGTRWRRQ